MTATPNTALEPIVKATASRTQPVMESVTQNFSAAHMMLWFAFCDETGNLIETHEQAGEFKEP